MALGKTPDPGLDGVLGICATTNSPDWLAVSFLTKLEQYHGFTAVFIDFYFERTHGVYKGFVRFAQSSTQAESMTYGGQL